MRRHYLRQLCLVDNRVKICERARTTCGQADMQKPQICALVRLDEVDLHSTLVRADTHIRRSFMQCGLEAALRRELYERPFYGSGQTCTRKYAT